MLSGIDPKTDLPDWTLLHEVPLIQMVCDQPIAEVESSEAVIDLTADDVPDMLHLVELADPGPFLPRTIEMGHYIGIRKAGQLVSMAGERFYLTGYHQVSSVCTHPDYQGKGYARLLVSLTAVRQQREGDTPFLHVAPNNTRAKALYERLGFHERHDLQVFIFQR